MLKIKSLYENVNMNNRQIYDIVKKIMKFLNLC